MKRKKSGLKILLWTVRNHVSSQCKKNQMGLRNHCSFSVADWSMSCCIFLARYSVQRLRQRFAQLYCKWLRVKSCCNLTMAVFGEVPSSLRIISAINVIIRRRRSKCLLQSLLKFSIALLWISILHFKQNTGLPCLKQAPLSSYGHLRLGLRMILVHAHALVSQPSRNAQEVHAHALYPGFHNIIKFLKALWPDAMLLLDCMVRTLGPQTMTQATLGRSVRIPFGHRVQREWITKTKIEIIYCQLQHMKFGVYFPADVVWWELWPRQPCRRACRSSREALPVQQCPGCPS